MELAPTGNDLIDFLRDVQTWADRIDDTPRKISKLRETLTTSPYVTMRGTLMCITCGMVISKAPELKPNHAILYDQGLTFIGNLATISYINSPYIPIDSLALDFTSPNIIGASDRANELLAPRTFRVPVLAIDKCIDVDIPD